MASPDMASPPRLVYADGPDGPLPDPARVAGLGGLRGLGGLGGLGSAGELEVVLGWVVRDAPPAWWERLSRPATTLLVGPGTRRAVADGTARAVGARLSATPELLAGVLRPTVAVVAGVADGDGFRFAGSVGWAPAAARHADAVVVERWPGPVRFPSLPVPGRIVAVIDRDDPPDALPVAGSGPLEQQIGRLAAALIPEGATVQWGPGAIGAAVVAAITRPVRVHSGLVTDELVGLAGRGLLVGVAKAAYLWGGPELVELAASGRLAVQPVNETHDLGAIAAIERFVAINTAIEVGLDGAVNVERAGRRLVAGPGGHPDFCVGASRSRGGLSVVALRSTAGSAARSTIVAQPVTVSTPRSDVDVVVTEHGIADLRGLDDATRAARMITVAAPEHRASLREAAEELYRR